MVPDPWAAAEDAFQHPWDNLNIYAFPPFCLIRVAPKWPHAVWYPDLLALLSKALREIPPWHNFPCQPHVERFHQVV